MPCFRSLQCKVETTVTRIPPDAVLTKIIWNLDRSCGLFLVTALLLGYDNKIYHYDNTFEQLIQCLSETDSSIKADYNRILVYFRLFGRIMSDKCTPDKRTMNIIKANISGLDEVPGNKIWAELEAILGEATRFKIMRFIFKCGGFKHIGLPANANFDEFKNMGRRVNACKAKMFPITFMCSFINTHEEAVTMNQRLSMPAYERNLALFIVKYKAKTKNIDDFNYFRSLYSKTTILNNIAIKEYVLELLKYHNKSQIYYQIESP
ncbi:CCA tRNA nucleotidyltransferase 1, mitochondrial, partial [Pseudolycoriella hygida]